MGEDARGVEDKLGHLKPSYEGGNEGGSSGTKHGSPWSWANYSRLGLGPRGGPVEGEERNYIKAIFQTTKGI